MTLFEQTKLEVLRLAIQAAEKTTVTNTKEAVKKYYNLFIKLLKK